MSRDEMAYFAFGLATHSKRQKLDPPVRRQITHSEPDDMETKLGGGGHSSSRDQ